MTNQVLFVQGGGEDVHDEWDRKLVLSLERSLGGGYAVSYPRMPNEHATDHATWSRALQEELGRLGDGAIVVGHSVGGTILIDVLARLKTKPRLRAVCLIAAPFIGEGGWQAEGHEPPDNFADAVPGGVPVFLYQGTSDQTVPFHHVELYARAIPQAAVRALHGRDHQLDNDLAVVASDILDLER